MPHPIRLIMNQDRITLQEILGTFLRRVGNFEHGLFGTITTLFTNPAEVVNTYLNVDRKRFTPAVSYALFALSIYAIGNYFLLDYTAEMMAFVDPEGNTVDFGPDSPLAYLNGEKEILVTVRYFNIIFFLLLPLFAFITWIILRRADYNYAEHVVINIYMTAQTTLLYPFILGLFALLSPLTGVGIGTYFLFVSISFVYYVWFFRSVFKRSWLGAFGKVVQFFFLYLLLNFAIFGNYGFWKSAKASSLRKDGVFEPSFQFKLILIMLIVAFVSYLAFRFSHSRLTRREWIGYPIGLAVVIGIIFLL
ncbi:MAG: DUF3667 domain-containing protein [Saprospiraceae bacterium]